jgi:hypothetical protein
MAAILALDRTIFLIIALVVLLAVVVRYLDAMAAKILREQRLRIGNYVSARTRRMRSWHHDASGPPA